MISSNLSDLAEMVEKNRNGKTVVLATGTFDLFHYEHLKYLEGAKKNGDILVVAVKSRKTCNHRRTESGYSRCNKIC